MATKSRPTIKPCTNKLEFPPPPGLFRSFPNFFCFKYELWNIFFKILSNLSYSKSTFRILCSKTKLEYWGAKPGEENN
ncbi:hypothetical protein QL285_045846 [Trifolium repens]|nr:hypothetical protein QL285_045846 [Trifolium repens]